MAKSKELYVLLRYWTEGGDTTGLDILGYTKNYSDGAKYLEKMANEHPYCDWELEEDLDPDEIVIEDQDEYVFYDDKPMVLDLYEHAELEACCRYKEKSQSFWTYCFFYIAAVEEVRID